MNHRTNENGTQSQPSKAKKLGITVVFVLFVGFVVVLLGYFAEHPRPTPPLPSDEQHAGLNDWKSCQDCHSDQGVSPLPETHPLKKDLCLRCHLPQGSDGGTDR